MARFNRDRGIHGLSQPVQNVGTQCSRSLEEFAKRLRWNSGIGRNLAHQATAVVNCPAQMPAERIFSLGLHHPIVPLGQFGQFVGDLRPIPTQLLVQFWRYVILRHLDMPYVPSRPLS